MSHGNITIDVPAELKSAAIDGVVAAAEAIFDYTEGKSQATINQDLKNAIEDVNAADEEDLTSVNVEGTDVLKFKDKAYTPANYSGLGRKYLRKNMVNGVNVLTQEMLPVSDVEGEDDPGKNTIYIIQYDYNLNGQTIKIPSGSIFLFKGGTISNGYLSGMLMNDEIDMANFNVEDLSVFINTLTLREGQHIKLKQNAIYETYNTINIATNNVTLDGAGATINSHAKRGIRIGNNFTNIYSGELVQMEDPNVIDSGDIASEVSVGDVLQIRENAPKSTDSDAYYHGVLTSVTDVSDTKVSLSIPVYRKQYDSILCSKDAHGIEVCNIKIINSYLDKSGNATHHGLQCLGNYCKIHNVYYDGADGAENGLTTQGFYTDIYDCEVCNVWHIIDGDIDNTAGYGINLAGNYSRAFNNIVYDCKACIDGGHRSVTIYNMEIFNNICSETYYLTKDGKESLVTPVLNKDHAMINVHGGVDWVHVYNNTVTVLNRHQTLAFRSNGIAENNLIYFYLKRQVTTVTCNVVRNYGLSSDFIWRNNRIIWGDDVNFAQTSYVAQISFADNFDGSCRNGSIIIEGNEDWPNIVYQGMHHVDRLIVRNNKFNAHSTLGRFLYMSIATANKIEIENNYIYGNLFIKGGSNVTFEKVKEFYLKNNTIDILENNKDVSVLNLRATTNDIWDRVIVEKNRICNHKDEEIPLFGSLKCLNNVSVVENNELINVYYDSGIVPEKSHFSSGLYDDIPMTDVVGYRYFAIDIKRNLYWDGNEWVMDNLTPVERFTIVPEMTHNARVFDNDTTVKIGAVYNWTKGTGTHSQKFDCCAISVPANVKVNIKGSGQGNYIYAWLMLDENNVVLAKSSTEMGGYNKGQILYKGVTSTQCTVLINVINEQATLEVEGEIISYPYWNKDGIPYVVELSAWNEFVIEDLLQNNNE